MLTLLSSPTSPFVRKVRIAMAMLGLNGRVAVTQTDTTAPDEVLRGANPLGKIPALVLENSDSLYDSRVIVDYLDELCGGGVLIPRGEARFAALRRQALFDGMMDAAVLIVYEKRFRAAENYDEGWVRRQKEKIARCLSHAEAELSTPAPELHIGHITQACALGFLDLRPEAGVWRPDHPKLVAWLADFEARVPSFAETRAPS